MLAGDASHTAADRAKAEPPVTDVRVSAARHRFSSPLDRTADRYSESAAPGLEGGAYSFFMTSLLHPFHDTPRSTQHPIGELD